MELTDIEKDHQLFMRNIVKSLADTPYELDALIIGLSENINRKSSL